MTGGSAPTSRRAAVALYRTLLKLTRDMKGILGSSSAPLPLRVTDKNLPWAGVELSTVGDLNEHTRSSFRESTTHKTIHDRISFAVQGVSALDAVVQKLRIDGKSQLNQQGEDTSNANISIGSPDLVRAGFADLMQQSIEEADEWAINWIAETVEWLPPIAEMTTENENVSSAKSAVFPCFPLTSPFYRPNQPLAMFSSESYSEQSGPGDTNVQLQIFEPRYRAMYEDLLVQKNKQESSESSGFVVPFAHPSDVGRFAIHGLLYQITDVQEVADETQGQIQYVCRHSIHPRPVRISKIVNPQDHQTRETYLKVEGGHLDVPEQKEDLAKREFPKVVQELQPMAEQGHGFAVKALHALLVRGVWSFVKVWNSALQERLLQTELKLAAQMKLLQRQSYDQSKGSLSQMETEDLIAHVQLNHRRDLLSLQLESALIIPRLLQCPSANEQEEVLLQLIETEKARKPFPRRS